MYPLKIGDVKSLEIPKMVINNNSETKITTFCLLCEAQLIYFRPLKKVDTSQLDKVNYEFSTESIVLCRIDKI